MMRTVSVFSCLRKSYLTILSSDARALFERAVGTFPADKARLLWERWARYEYQYGSLEAALKLEKRMAEVFPNGSFTIFRSSPSSSHSL